MPSRRTYVQSRTSGRPASAAATSVSNMTRGSSIALGVVEEVPAAVVELGLQVERGQAQPPDDLALRVPEQPLRPGVEHLDDAVRVGRDDRLLGRRVDHRDELVAGRAAGVGDARRARPRRRRARSRSAACSGLEPLQGDGAGAQTVGDLVHGHRDDERDERDEEAADDRVAA